MYLYVKASASHSRWRSRDGQSCVHETASIGVVTDKIQSAVTRDPVGFRTLEGVEPMGRGRAKAKQVKVARQLKYNGGGTDLDRLRAELGVSTDQHDEDSAYADLGDSYSEDDDSDEDDGDDEDWDADDVGDYDTDDLTSTSA